MSAAVPTVVYNKPTAGITCFSLTKSRRPTKFPTTKLIFSEKSVLLRSASWDSRGWSLNTMAELNKAPVLKVSRGDEGVRAFEQEAFIDGSSEFRTNFTPVGPEVILNYLSKWLVTAIFCAALLLRHDAEAMWAALGSVLNGVLSVILKQILNQERPTTAKSDPGMPSSHAQCIFFTVVFSIFSMVQWLGVNGLTTTFSGLALVLGSYLSWLRVSLQFHTINQIIVGAVVGSVFSLSWFWLWDAIVSKAFISYLWVRIFVVLGSGGFCVGFGLYVIRYWVMDEMVDFVRRMIKSFSNMLNSFVPSTRP